jgi:hypothetical protein
MVWKNKNDSENRTGAATVTLAEVPMVGTSSYIDSKYKKNLVLCGHTSMFCNETQLNQTFILRPWAECLENVWASTSHKPVGFRCLLQK